MTIKQAVCVIFVSPNGRDSWTPVKPEDVPDWVKKPDVMARLVDGNMAQNTNGVIAPDEVRPWYRAQVATGADEIDRIAAAHAKRKRKNARRVSTVH